MAPKGQCGAYGFRIVPSDPSVVLPGLIPMAEDADEAHIAWAQASPLEDELEVTEDRVRVTVKNQITIDVVRSSRSVFVALPDAPTPEAVVHPVATTPLAILARWRGNVTLHAGAVLHDGGAYAICGGQGAGKSTMLALLAQTGLPIVADDLVVADRGDVLAGPRCVDLRPDTASRFPEARFLGTVGRRQRFRLSTPSAPARVPMRGLFLLEWSTDAEPRVLPLSLQERARVVHGFDYAAIVGLARPDALLDMLELPMWRLSRPRDWASTPRTLDRLLSTAATH